ncbi:hypothetical protein ACQ859_18615 [Roseateles chitinivorans]|uniref:hypothetical protein n=1 Tax=Roseateles chitinivorans TaxID=2917965 RepID=UPI003D673836
MSSTIPTARAINVPPPSAETLTGPQTQATPMTPAVVETPSKPSSSEHILPEGLSSRRSSRDATKTDGGSEAPVRSRPSTPPRQSAPKVLSRASSASSGGAGRAADPHGSGENIPMTPLTPNLNGSSSSLASDALRTSGGAPSITEQRRSAATETGHSSALPRETHDEITQLTRGMPGSFDPLPRAEADPGPRAPGGLASLSAATVPSPRDVNPRIDIGSLAQKLPEDVTGCVAYLLSAMRQGPEDIPALERLATQQAAVLESRGIHNRDDFVSVLKQVQWRDQGTAMMHGMASASGFNLGTIPANLKLADLTLTSLMKAMPSLPVAVPALITGALMGFALSMLDVASGAATGKTFKDAYYTRPPGEQLPEPLASANAPTKTSLAADNSKAAGLSYGAVRNGLVRIPAMLNYELKGQPEKRAAMDGILDPALGLPLGGGGMRVIKNDFDVSAGRAGFQHLLARDDLGACLDHLQKPAAEQILSAAARAGAHVKNLKSTFPEALGDVFASKVGWTSHAILSAGFGGLTAMVASLPTTLMQNYGLSEKDANVTTQMLKYVVLQALYHVWGGALGAVGGPKAPDPAAVSHA